MGVMNEDRLTLYDGLIKTHITNTTVAKETGKGLSTNDYTTTEKNKLAGIATGANKTIVDSALNTSSDNPVQNKVIASEINTLKKSVVAKEDGKGLSTNDYTTTEKNKLAGIADGANKTIVDSALNTSSTNPVQNKVIASEINTLKKSVVDGKTLEQVIDTHTGKGVYGSDGVHGLRYYNDTLQVKNDEGSWVDIETGGGGISPSNVSDLKIKVGNQKLTIFWSDPGNTVVEGQTLCTWKGTKLVQKAGSYPTSVKDGTLLLDNQTLDAYKTNGYEINGLTNGTTYYFALFPYADTSSTNINKANRISGTPKLFRKMTAIIDLSNSNPTSSVTYADDAVRMTAGSSAWDDFFGHYPVLLKNGVEVGKLQRNNFDKFEDGTTADISSGNAGDAMIAFPRMGLSIKTVGTRIYVSMTDDPDNADFEYNAHTRGTTPKDVFYLGVYKGYVESNKLRSLKGKTITASQTIGTFRTQAQANGDGYEQSGFYQLTFRQAMFILKYKTLNSQSAVGMGYVLKSHTAAIASGGTEAWGMDCELIKATNPTYMTDQNHHVKCFGLEDFWGNSWEWIDGIVSDSSRNVLTANSGFNDNGSGYINNGNGGVSSDIGSYMSKPHGSTKAGFVVKGTSGSTTTYFCDYAFLNASSVAWFGGRWNDAANAGAFLLYLAYASPASPALIAARLMYL